MGFFSVFVPEVEIHFLTDWLRILGSGQCQNLQFQETFFFCSRQYLHLKVKITLCCLYAGIEERQRCSSNSLATLVLEQVYGQHHALVDLLPGGTQNHTGDWVSLGADLDSHGKSRTHQYSIPRPCSP